jgi:hypothetical protein
MGHAVHSEHRGDLGNSRVKPKMWPVWVEDSGCFLGCGLRGASLGRAMLLVVGIPQGFSEREVTSPYQELRVDERASACALVDLCLDSCPPLGMSGVRSLKLVPCLLHSLKD